jgi:hypothetical protein
VKSPCIFTSLSDNSFSNSLNNLICFIFDLVFGIYIQTLTPPFVIFVFGSLIPNFALNYTVFKGAVTEYATGSEYIKEYKLPKMKQLVEKIKSIIDLVKKLLGSGTAAEKAAEVKELEKEVLEVVEEVKEAKAAIKSKSKAKPKAKK